MKNFQVSLVKDTKERTEEEFFLFVFPVVPVLIRFKHTEKMAAVGNKISSATIREMVLSQLISDASLAGCHWQYKAEQIAESAEKDGNPVLFPKEESHLLNPFYRIQKGEGTGNTFYGDQTLSLLRSLNDEVAKKEKDVVEVNVIGFAKRLRETFGGGGGYGPWPEAEVSRSDYPVPRGWRSHSLKSFLSSVDQKEKELSSKTEEEKIYLNSASSDDQSDCLAKVSLLVGLSALDDQEFAPKYASKLQEIVSVTQLGEAAYPSALLAARILLALLSLPEVPTPENHGEIITGVLKKVREQFSDQQIVLDAIDKALSNSKTSHTEFVAENGKGCGLIYNLVNGIHALLVFNSLADSVKATVLAGGDSGGRTAFIGAAFGALTRGEKRAFPSEWIDEYPGFKEAEEKLKRVFP